MTTTTAIETKADLAARMVELIEEYGWRPAYGEVEWTDKIDLSRGLCLSDALTFAVDLPVDGDTWLSHEISRSLSPQPAWDDLIASANEVMGVEQPGEWERVEGRTQADVIQMLKTVGGIA